MSLSRRGFLQMAGAGLAAAQSATTRPNIVVLYSDDQTYRTIHALNNPEIQTPNLDRLCARGTAFTHACIMGGLQGAVCVPSRAMLMSGQSLFHATANVVKQKENYGPAREFEMFPEVFGRAGYTTYGIGKWHNRPPLYQRTFQNGSAIFFGGMFDQYTTPVHDYDPAGQYPTSAAKPQNRHSSEVFADAAIGFLKNRDRAKPFLLYCAFTSPHDPRQAPKEYKAMYPEDKIELPPNYLPEHPFDNGELKIRDEELLPWPRTRAAIRKELSDYYAIITHLDAQVGRILGTLESEGLTKNTIIVFAGDNGLAVGQHGLLGKQNLYDHSIRVPLIMAGPGIPSNQKSEAAAYLFDIFPTLSDLSGMPKPKFADGKSLVPVLKNPKLALRESRVFAYRHVQRAIRTTQWKFIRYNASGVQNQQLFDVRSDPWEMKDLSKQASMSTTVKQLDAEMQRLLREEGDPLDLTKPDWAWKG